ncbi:MAG: Asp-tRNA(Asn)/Glu-tRNA(Gln) amidotransferase subunit GatB [Clostridiales bacterium]|nr:Asp-tRNA(Asn)/Glu-tRNA(Gln) amidotransferase subunit GatB [Candidatus Apopatousia equi]
MDYEIVVGLEIHSELKTKTKAFCSCENKFGLPINTATCPVCMGLPGALPTINMEAVKYSIKSGLSFDCKINNHVVFERKNYFYPDLSKAYQISQLEYPICEGGKIRYKLNGEEKVCRINNIHMEEDAGKNIHDDKQKISLVDFNRCGVPLIEIVTEPDIRSSEEAMKVLESIKETLMAIEVSDCKMQEGSLRCDVNISLHKKGEPFGTRTEMKNLNSFKAVGRAIEYEVSRQAKLLDNGEKIVQETRRWDDMKGENYALRSKENSNDYRYFPDPDLKPVCITNEYIKEIKNELPELPYDKKERYEKVLGLSEHDISVLTLDKNISNYFESALSLYNNPKIVANWVMGDLLKKIKEDYSEDYTFKITPEHLVELISMVENKELSVNSSKEVLDEVWGSDKSPKLVAQDLGLMQTNDSDEIEGIVDEVISTFTDAVNDYKGGNERTFTFLVGQVMKLSKGKANAQIVRELMQKKLSN